MIGAGVITVAGAIADFFSGKTKSERQEARAQRKEERQERKEEKKAKKAGASVDLLSAKSGSFFDNAKMWFKKNWPYVLAGVGALVAVVVIWKLLFGKKKTRRRGNASSLAKARRAKAAKRRRK